MINTFSATYFYNWFTGESQWLEIIEDGLRFVYTPDPPNPRGALK